MNELIKIREENGKQLVSARELYLGLGLDRSQWSRWNKSNIRRNSFFKEGVDWKEDLSIISNNTTDFKITLEFANHLINSAKTISSNKKIEILKQMNLYGKADVLAKKEINFLAKLEDIFKPFNIQGIRQYSVLTYRIDYYIPQLNIAIEYDENNHSSYTYEQHELRQKLIEKELGCKFIRVSDNNSDEFNAGYVLKEILGIRDLF